MTSLRVAIIGAGPAGIYAADLLRKAERDVALEVDIFEQLPAPYGLVRYGVAPDHPRIKGIITALREVLDSGAAQRPDDASGSTIRLFGNVRFGEDLGLADLQRHYHAAIFATGAIRDAELALPGITAAGSFGAADFVSWFDGHPDVPREWPLHARQVAVIGNGNVALDISRMLIKHAEDLQATEVPDNVYQLLAANPIEDVHIFGRRGPLSVKFTPLELRELGELRDVDMVLDERDFAVVDHYAEEAKLRNKQLLVISRILQSWRDDQRAREAGDAGEVSSTGEAHPASRRIHLHFWAQPVAIECDETGAVAGITIERTAPDGAGGITMTGERETIPVQALYRAIGYFGSPLPEVPFDAARGVIPNVAGRVIGADGAAIPGLYTTGWIKRGPVGLIGHTKSDAMETIEALLADRARWWEPVSADADAIPALLAEREIPYTTIAGWHRLDAHERALGEAEGRARIKVVPREEMTRISRGE